MDTSPAKVTVKMRNPGRSTAWAAKEAKVCLYWPEYGLLGWKGGALGASVPKLNARGYHWVKHAFACQ